MKFALIGALLLSGCAVHKHPILNAIREHEQERTIVIHVHLDKPCTCEDSRTK
jgi:hypothetical protein